MKRHLVTVREAEKLHSTCGVSAVVADRPLTEEEMFAQESARIPGEDEEQFATTVDLASQTYWWHDKFRPRKPRFFNRVHTGYDWNKYNQSHYVRLLCILYAHF